MALGGGYVNRVAWIDLTEGQIEYKPIAEEDARKYIGARGLGVKYVFDNGPQVEPLSPDNILCFMNGPLTGTDVNLSGRMAVVTKSPLTGTVTDSHHGGWSAARLKWAGFDGLVFKGKADKPVYAYVEDGKVTLHDASDLWGKHVHETIKILQERHGGEKDLSVLTIGPAGENLVKFACWMNENDRSSGRGGTGCVGGSKNLKAIVIKGKHADRPKPADKEAFKAAQKVALAQLSDERVLTSPRKGGLSVYGTNVLMNITSNMGGLPVRNGQETSFGDRAELLSGEHVKATILVNDPTCHACPVACKKEVEVKEGPFKVHMESVEYEPAWSVGAFCGNDDIAAVAYLIDRANDYGYRRHRNRHRAGDVHGVHRRTATPMVTAWPGATPTAWSRWPARSRSAKAWATSLPRARARPRRSWVILSSPWRARIRASRPTTRAASRVWASATLPRIVARAICAATPPRPRWPATCSAPRRWSIRWPGKARAT